MNSSRFKYKPSSTFRSASSVYVRKSMTTNSVPLSSRKARNSRNRKLNTPNSMIRYLSDRDEIQNEIQNDLNFQYQQLKEEIASLQCDLKPLRQTFLKLQNDILMHHRALVSGDDELDSDALHAAVTAGDFSSAIVQFQNESENLSKQLAIVKQLFSKNSLKLLNREVEDGEDSCATLQNNVEELEREIQKNVSQYETYKLSKMYEEVQQQKEKIYNLTARLDEAMQTHVKLKSEHFLLSDSSNDNTFLDEATTISKLTRKLNAARRKHFEQCELLIAIRSKQLKEVESVSGVINSNKESSTSFYSNTGGSDV